MMKNYLRDTINRMRRALEGESFNARKAALLAQISKVKVTRERYKTLNKRADKLCKEIKAVWLDKIKAAAKAGKVGIIIKKPRIEMLESEPVYTKLVRKFKKLGYKVERDRDEFTIEWGE